MFCFSHLEATTWSPTEVPPGLPGYQLIPQPGKVFPENCYTTVNELSSLGSLEFQWKEMPTAPDLSQTPVQSKFRKSELRQPRNSLFSPSFALKIIRNLPFSLSLVPPWPFFSWSSDASALILKLGGKKEKRNCKYLQCLAITFWSSILVLLVC